MVVTEKKFFIELDNSTTKFYLVDAMGGNVSYTTRIQEACLFTERDGAENAIWSVRRLGITNPMTIKPVKITYQVG